MKEININNFKEKLYYEELDNGLKVFLVPLLHKNNFYFSYNVKFGGRDIKFKIDNKTYNVPTGIAHFLEHKLFERENDPFNFYQKSGVEVNASTSYDYTSYYICGNKSIKKNLSYLLDWLKKVELTDENIEKEKGIILEEASMYKDVPSRILGEKVKYNTFVIDPYRYKVIGTDEDIKKITKQDLELCFNSFYKPSNMFIIGAGNFNKDEVIELIKEKTKDIKKSSTKIEKCYDKESDDVYKEYEEILLNIDTPRIGVAYKFNKKIFSKLNVTSFELDLYLHIILNIALGISSEIREKWLKQDLFIESLYRIIENDTHYVIEFDAASNKCDLLLEELKKYLKDIVINKEDFEREKKLWIAGEIQNSVNIGSINYNILDDVLDYGDFIPNKLEIINKLNYDKLKELKEILSFDKCAVVKILSK